MPDSVPRIFWIVILGMSAVVGLLTFQHVRRRQAHAKRDEDIAKAMAEATKALDALPPEIHDHILDEAGPEARAFLEKYRTPS